MPMLLLAAGLLLAGEPDTRALPAEQAAARMGVPEGFRVQVFAAEPDVTQPIGFCFDHRGRLWVVENKGYPDWSHDGAGSDRVLIFEDTDGDGVHDRRTVFLENGSNLSGIQVGYGGVWLCSLPNFLFVPDADGDDTPDGPPQILLDGWSLECKHNVFNGLTWGPDGWLYGMNGITAVSHVGQPGTPAERRHAFDCGVWRYHPTRHAFEPVAWGTTNPWGLDFDEHGQMFVTNCVIAHLFHVQPGSHYDRMFGADPNEHVYDLTPSVTDYYHFAGRWQDSREGAVGASDADSLGGGHAHVGCMIYQADQWPEEYRGELFTCNLHGRRVNRDSLRQVGSGYRSERRPDGFFSADPWFRGLELKYGPDGAVYLTDWSDTGECHDADHCDTSGGRIYRVTHGVTKASGGRQPALPFPTGSAQERKGKEPRVDARRSPATADLATLPAAQLVGLHDHPNQWSVRHARQVLAERAATDEAVVAELAPLLLARVADADRTEVGRLEALWTLHAVGGTTPEILAGLLDSGGKWLRHWAVRLLVDHPEDHAAVGPDSPVGRLVALARAEREPVVRAALASAAQRVNALPRFDTEDGRRLRLALGRRLVNPPEPAPPTPKRRAAAFFRWLTGRESERAAEPVRFADDVHLSRATWYALEPLVSRGGPQAAELIHDCIYPDVRRDIARRLVSRQDPADLLSLVDVLAAQARWSAPGEVPDGLVPGLAGDLLTHERLTGGTSGAVLGSRREDILDVLTGMNLALADHPNTPMPGNWPETYRLVQEIPDPAVRKEALLVAVAFGDPQALGAVEGIVVDPQRSAEERNDALRTVRRLPDLDGERFAAMVRGLLDDGAVQAEAVRALATVDDPLTPDALLSRYPRLPADVQRDVRQTLATRKGYAQVLLTALESGAIPPTDLSAYTARQLLGLGDADLTRRLEAVWGKVGTTSAEQAAKVADYKRMLGGDWREQGDAADGRLLFRKNCANCHRLFGDGERIGPELTGAQRTDLDYLLHNVVDPDALVARQYRNSVVATADGRVVTGVVVRETAGVLVLQTATELVTLPVADVAARRLTEQSLMPDGLLDKLSDDEVKDLLRYLGSDAPLPAPQESLPAPGS